MYHFVPGGKGKYLSHLWHIGLVPGFWGKAEQLFARVPPEKWISGD